MKIRRRGRRSRCGSTFKYQSDAPPGQTDVRIPDVSGSVDAGGSAAASSEQKRKHSGGAGDDRRAEDLVDPEDEVSVFGPSGNLDAR